MRHNFPSDSLRLLAIRTFVVVASAMIGFSCEMFRPEVHHEAVPDDNSWRGGVPLAWHSSTEAIFPTRATSLAATGYNGTIKGLASADKHTSQFFVLRGLDQPKWFAPSKSTVLIYQSNELVGIERFTDTHGAEAAEEIFESTEDLYGDMGAADVLSRRTHVSRRHGTDVTNFTDIVIYRVQNEKEGVVARCEVKYALLDPNLPFTKLPRSTRVLSVLYYTRDAITITPPNAPAITSP